MQVLDVVRQFIRRNDLVRPDGSTRVVAAVSGGSDSVALLHLLAALAAQDVVRLAGVAHFNHQLRRSADSDERFVASLAASLALPFVADRADVAAQAQRDRQSIENAGRRARHAFFARAAGELRADVVALGHTRDDQAETFLLRLTRGAGMRGLAGMHARHGLVIRPLLECRRAALRTWLDERHIAFVEDDSNADVAIPRNRVRAELVPLLEARFNPSIVDVLADEARLAGEAWEWMAEAARELLTTATRSPGVLDIATLQRAPTALMRLAVWEALNGENAMSFDHVEAVLRLIRAGKDGSLDIPGQRVKRDGDRLVLTCRPPGTKGRWGKSAPVPARRVNLET